MPSSQESHLTNNSCCVLFRKPSVQPEGFRLRWSGRCIRLFGVACGAARTRPCRNSSVRARTVRNIRAPSEHHGITGCRPTAASCHCCHGQQTGSPGTGGDAWGPHGRRADRGSNQRIARRRRSAHAPIEVSEPNAASKPPALPEQLTESRHVARAKLEPGGGGVEALRSTARRTGPAATRTGGHRRRGAAPRAWSRSPTGRTAWPGRSPAPADRSPGPGSGRAGVRRSPSSGTTRRASRPDG